MNHPYYDKMMAELSDSPLKEQVRRECKDLPPESQLHRILAIKLEAAYELFGRLFTDEEVRQDGFKSELTLILIAQTLLEVALESKVLEPITGKIAFSIIHRHATMMQAYQDMGNQRRPSDA